MGRSPCRSHDFPTQRQNFHGKFWLWQLQRNGGNSAQLCAKEFVGKQSLLKSEQNWPVHGKCWSWQFTESIGRGRCHTGQEVVVVVHGSGATGFGWWEQLLNGGRHDLAMATPLSGLTAITIMLLLVSRSTAWYSQSWCFMIERRIVSPPVPFPHPTPTPHTLQPGRCLVAPSRMHGPSSGWRWPVGGYLRDI